MKKEFALTSEALSSAIAEWLEKGEVSISNLPIRFANAIISKELDGGISLLEKHHRNGYKKRDCCYYVWGASVAETTLEGDKARPLYMGLFHNDLKEFIDKSTAQTTATFISSHKRAIANSVKK